MTSQLLTRQILSLRLALYAFTKRFTKDHDESLDLVQDTILKALMNQEKFRDDKNLKGWLFTIMRNIFINNYQKARRSRTYSEEIKQQFSLPSRGTARTLDDPASNVEYHDILKSVNSISNELLVPFQLYVSGYKYNEIAENQGIPLGTVKNRIFKARQEIMKKLAG